MTDIELKWAVVDCFSRHPGNGWRPIGVCFKRDVGVLGRVSGAPWTVTARIDGATRPRAIVHVTNDSPEHPLFATPARNPLTKREMDRVVAKIARMKETFRREGYHGNWYTVDLFNRFKAPVAFSRRIESMEALDLEYRRLSALTVARQLRFGDVAEANTEPSNDNGAVPSPRDWQVLDFFRIRAGQGWYPLGIDFLRRHEPLRKHGLNWIVSIQVGTTMEGPGATVHVSSDMARPPRRPLSPANLAATIRMLERAKGRMGRIGFTGGWEKHLSPATGAFSASFTKRFRSRADVEREHRRLNALSPSLLVC